MMSPVDFYKCISDETRLRCILLIFKQEELCVCELTEALNEIQPKISRHLAQLRKCGLIQDRRQGQWVFYRISTDLPLWMVSVISTTQIHNQQLIDEDLQRLQQMSDRPDNQKNCCG
ncbi:MULTISPECIES: metalloregulator ArsR/SmtB family transcription factor [unclassified Methylophaga]|jgi:ArsR family transcriptional regulator|uniref:metalloregulator ArsR/SmtB family transcription factor n=2 Tax=unclassified Methylophaga TaxID=2629249 RepID=UPI00259CCA04|nr:MULTISPECIES: metalloregulator ArsR/SmtB family transcription factor [unclassified Methylophaga]|tara:strand:- start:753 stop:1103 length:351 start_codon:yes stop_codon:yes gene_type:complete